MTAARATPNASLGAIIERILEASAARRALHISGGGSKRFLAAAGEADELSIAAHRGIVSYEPSEMVITARAGTPLVEIDAALGEHGQMLGFEPPHFGAGSTIGGVIACGLSGPARPYRGSARDFVLGVELVNGLGQVLQFGGQVMKNVAGYDISRLVTGAYGSLGVISSVSLRVLPRPQREATLNWQLASAPARRRMLELSRQPWPVSAMCADGDTLSVRVSGSEQTVADAITRLAPDTVADVAQWRALRDLQAPPLPAGEDRSLWRLSLPAAAPDPDFAITLCDWGGAQRWLETRAGAVELRTHCAAHGGHATCMRRAADETEPVFTAPDAALRGLMVRIKRAFDPAGIFNPQLYFDWM